MKEKNKHYILSQVVRIIEEPESHSEACKKFMAATIKIIADRMIDTDNEIFDADVTKSEYETYLKSLLDEYGYDFLNEQIKKEYEGVDNENS